jgi:hypothetical protein
MVNTRDKTMAEIGEVFGISGEAVYGFFRLAARAQ